MDRSGYGFFVGGFMVVLLFLVMASLLDNRQRGEYTKACNDKGGEPLFRIAAQPLCVPKGTIIIIQ